MAEFFPTDPDKDELSFSFIPAHQPIGDIYLAAVPYETIVKVTSFDVRRVLQEDRDVERYLGIQRPVIQSRLKSLNKYVNFLDATFPTAVILALDEDYVEIDPATNRMVVRNWRAGETQPSTALRNIGRVLDGQHRIAGLEHFKPTVDSLSFDIPTVIFVGADIADQAQIFATVNLEQTKVNKSLVYDLSELATTRSPDKTCHNIAVTLDQKEDSPFYRRIKRLGIGSTGRSFEPISQATFVEGLRNLVSSEPKVDRDTLLRGRKLEPVDSKELRRLPFRNLFIQEDDIAIAKIVFDFFTAVKNVWEEAWNNQERGGVLNRTNGVKALFRFLRDSYWICYDAGNQLSRGSFEEILKETTLKSEHFTTAYFAPGTSGESKLYNVLLGNRELTTIEQDAKAAIEELDQK